MKTSKVRVGLVGSQFISTIHAEALKRCADAELFAVASPTPGHANEFARKHGIPHVFSDYPKMMELDELDLVVIGAPNDTHGAITLAAAAGGKHVVCEKPLCLNLAEADQMIAACQKAKVQLMYAEELCFAPKYVRLKQLLDEGALGKPVLVKQSEKHDGPHAPHFWDVRRAGGGVTMDMGCHAIEFFRWMLGRPPITSVYAQMGTYVHSQKTQGEDHALLILEFANGALGLAEESWTKLGGMDDRAEVHGSKGVAYADLLHGNAIETYSSTGYGYAVEKAGSTIGWSFTIYEEIWNYGFVQEMEHFVDCVKTGKPAAVNGADGRAVLEAIFAAYASAGTGRKIQLPFASPAPRPIDLWRKLEASGP
ncbi:MAG TPA: Gfo/Idh/MocA family oxidoreductase [Candidatus Paceibacterota bacterium]|nr:Gfo/Idh/MocA family oxidoreductase [Verrucomicrobiota bacterium]HRY47571.1 Gfo/Idh/MocA family oxidoreductase [Candidatus Paceibacterota bacterium]HRZ99226.1 Gfo/Idh/MocA family oxidoreductase [Candidatus Paceibacterota bacterium]